MAKKKIKKKQALKKKSSKKSTVKKTKKKIKKQKKASKKSKTSSKIKLKTKKKIKTKTKSKTDNKDKKKSADPKKSKHLLKTKKTDSKSKKLKALLTQREKELQKILSKEKEEKMILKDMQGRTYCQMENCDYSAVAEGYCRIHFFGLYKIIKKKKEILEQDVLTKKISQLVNKHSEEVFEPLFKDSSSDKSFKTALKKITSEDTEEIDI